MCERDEWMRKIQMLDFALYELTLYLDTHPTCRQALAQFERTKAERESVAAAYVDKYGPIVASQARDRNRWSWVASPWPWEGDAN